MFELHPEAKFLGHDEEGMAVFGLEKNRHKLLGARKSFNLDMNKVAEARANAERVAAMMGS